MTESKFSIPADTPTFNLRQHIPTIRFHDQTGSEIGKLAIDNGVMSFQGNAEESAKVFFENVIKLYRGNQQ